MTLSRRRRRQRGGRSGFLLYIGDRALNWERVDTVTNGRLASANRSPVFEPVRTELTVLLTLCLRRGGRPLPWIILPRAPSSRLKNKRRKQVVYVIPHLLKTAKTLGAF